MGLGVQAKKARAALSLGLMILITPRKCRVEESPHRGGPCCLLNNSIHLLFYLSDHGLVLKCSHAAIPC